MSFRLNAQTFFLTYPQCPLSKEVLLYELQQKVDIKDYVICRELHETGEPHLHAYIKTTRKYNFKKQDCFDVLSIHGNYQACRSPAAVMKYVEKDGDYITNITIKTKGEWSKAMEIARQDAPEALSYIQDHYPRDYFLHSDAITRTVTVLSAKPTIPKYENFKMPDELKFWDRSKQCLFIHGESGLGKTEFSKWLLGSCYLCSELDAIKEFDPLIHKGIIFDDITLGLLPKESVLSLIDLENTRQVKCRYRNAVIPAGTPRIITSNSPPTHVAEWWNRRVFEFHVINSLIPSTNEQLAEIFPEAAEDMEYDFSDEAMLDRLVNTIN